ncbi:hypothetical protein BD833_103211 [Blastococcus xanthinilyticus]|uniref:Uncharacterized protein n=1 Tax=Blastococcus xanthinilyticus TaxID=1564164 RepID=A0A5S5CZW2_9ACTN|nr:hypothetical protein BD833_103211 [Blastococcus xanthinilyticus]
MNRRLLGQVLFWATITTASVLLGAVVYGALVYFNV